MTLKTRTVEYNEFEGFLAFDDSFEGERPVVVIFHAWKGHDPFVQEKAKELAKLGYIGFAADVYGKGIKADTDEQAMALMLPLFQDRTLLQERAQLGVKVAKEQPEVDPSKCAAIGFCFGGLTVLELLRSGEEINGIVSFHGLLADKLGDVVAKRPTRKPIKGAALFLHGNDDPMVSEHDIKETFHELSVANVDWQFTTYGGTVHAFTNPDANNPDQGLLYSPTVEKRALQAMRNFLTEIFGEKE